MDRMGKIADISKWQGNVNWPEAAKELDFVILRASCGMSEDTKYERNVDACIENGIPFGAYHYVKAGDADAARAEAEAFLKVTASKNRRPVFYIADIEYEAQTKTTTEAVCVAFLQTLRDHCCEKIGLYINTRYNWAGKAIDMCDIMWIPHWGKNDGKVPADSYKSSHPHDLWQYTSKGSLAGVSGNVDLNQLTGTKPMSYFIGSGQNGEEKLKEENHMFTNLEFAAFCLAVYAAKWVYWYGTCGYKCTTSRYNSKKNQYPAHYTATRESGYKKDIAEGRMCADCVGLIKAFFWLSGKLDGTSKYGANNCPDVSANGMYKKCVKTGPISTIPDIPGLIVWKSGHIGVYVGDGYTVEMKGFNYDCVKAKVTAGKWTNWGQLPASMLNYVSGEVAGVVFKLGDRTLAKGDKGEDVTELQEILVGLGFNLGTYGAAKNGVDGDFGTKTLNAVKAFQTANGLTVNGTVDAATVKALKPDVEPEPAPTPVEEQPTFAVGTKIVEITTGSVNARIGDSQKYDTTGYVQKGDKFEWVATSPTTGWHAIRMEKRICWVSPNYSKVVVV